MTAKLYQAPAYCPVCGDALITTRLGCRGCGSELAGEFGHCDFCALDERESELLRVFLASRGNLREVEKHLGKAFRPGAVHLVTELPKTRSQKIMRRVIRNLYTGQAPGDLTSLDNPSALDAVTAAQLSPIVLPLAVMASLWMRPARISFRRWNWARRNG